MDKKKMLAVSGAAAVSLLIAIPVFADTSTTTPSGTPAGTHQGHFRKGANHKTGQRGSGTHQPLANATFGTISNIDGSTITLTRNFHNSSSSPTMVTVTTTGSTTYKKNGQADTASDLAVGQRIVAMGTKDSSGNISNAISINIMVPRTPSTNTSS